MAAYIPNFSYFLYDKPSSAAKEIQKLRIYSFMREDIVRGIFMFCLLRVLQRKLYPMGIAYSKIAVLNSIILFITIKSSS